MNLLGANVLLLHVRGVPEEEVDGYRKSLTPWLRSNGIQVSTISTGIEDFRLRRHRGYEDWIQQVIHTRNAADTYEYDFVVCHGPVWTGEGPAKGAMRMGRASGTIAVGFAETDRGVLLVYDWKRFDIRDLQRWRIDPDDAQSGWWLFG